MVKEARPMVIWNKRASIYFRNIFDWIKRDTDSNAEKVRDGIIKIIDTLPENPEKYPPDKFKRNNTGLFGLLKNSLTEFHISLLLRK